MHPMMSPAAIKCKGAIALVLGVLFMLGTTGVLPSFTFATFWPLFLIVGGLHALVCKCMGGACSSKDMGGCGCGGKGECCKK